jgi:membrane protease subunit HflK
VADEEEAELDTDQKIQRSVARTLFNGLLFLVCAALLGGWAWTGLYMINPGEAAVVLRLGRYERTINDPGLRWHLPPPLEYVEKVDVAKIRRQEFGINRAEKDVGREGTAGSVRESAIQTADSNIVNLGYVVQYKVRNPFTFLYSMKNPAQTLHDATQAAVREVVGRHGIDDVLSANRAAIQNESRELLQVVMNSYVGGRMEDSPVEVLNIDLQDVQPPAEVQAAFEDVLSAQQDEVRAVSAAKGDSREIRESAGAKAVELTREAEAYKESKVLEASGEAARFEALLAEYRSAKAVTRRRLYIETMERVLPGVEKVIVEPDAVSVLPMLPLASGRGASGPGASGVSAASGSGAPVGESGEVKR